MKFPVLNYRTGVLQLQYEIEKMFFVLAPAGEVRADFFKIFSKNFAKPIDFL